MRITLLFLCSSLLLVCCGRPDSEHGRKDEPASDTKAVRIRHAWREDAPNIPVELREILEASISIEVPAIREKAIADVAWNALEIDPGLACEAFLQLSGTNPEKIRLIQHYAMRLADNSLDEALEWANSLETELETAAAIGQIALAIAETDPLRAANLLSESGVAGRDFDVAVVQVIQRWAAQSPPLAAGWVSSFPPGAAREAGIKYIAERWLPADASPAFRWFDSLKDTQFRQETARAIEGVLLQQPQHIRDAWLQHADARIQGELEQQREEAMKDVGDNIPTPTE